jgi:hypothetical protein
MQKQNDPPVPDKQFYVAKKSYPSFAHYENKDDFSVSKTLIRLQRSK